MKLKIKEQFISFSINNNYYKIFRRDPMHALQYRNNFIITENDFFFKRFRTIGKELQFGQYIGI